MSKFKKFDEYMYGIQEALNIPISVIWKKTKTSWTGQFKIEENTYTIKIKNYSSNKKHYLFKFDANGKFNLLNDIKKAYSTIPTIESAATEFIKIERPDVFIFCSTNDSKARNVFYDIFCKIIRIV